MADVGPIADRQLWATGALQADIPVHAVSETSRHRGVHLGQRVGQQARGRAHRCSDERANRLAAGRVDNGWRARIQGLQRIELKAARRNRRVAQLDLAQDPAWAARIANSNHDSPWPKGGKIAAGVDEAGWHPTIPQDIDRAIDGKSLGDPAEIAADQAAAAGGSVISRTFSNSKGATREGR